jgi:hypothetical protein
MGNQEFYEKFAKRLKDAMLRAGFESNRSPYGVCVQTLADATGHSLQICRRYLRGEAIPEPDKLTRIASKIGVTPGWLLFGEEHSTLHKNLVISPQNLKEILLQSFKLNHKLSPEILTEVILQLAQDVAIIEGSDDEIKKIIDMSFKAVKLSTV